MGMNQDRNTTVVRLDAVAGEQPDGDRHDEDEWGGGRRLRWSTDASRNVCAEGEVTDMELLMMPLVVSAGDDCSARGTARSKLLRCSLPLTSALAGLRSISRWPRG
jgi:hypothetical protein